MSSPTVEIPKPINSEEIKLAEYVPKIIKSLEHLGFEGTRRVLRSALTLVESGSLNAR